MCPVWHCWCQCVLTVHQWHARDNTEIWNMFPSCFIPLLCTHISVSPICSPADFCWHRNWRRLALFDLFMRWHSMLALSLSLSLASYSVFLLTAFVHFINIKFWYSDRYESPEDTCSFLLYQKYSLYFYLHLWQQDSDCLCCGRFLIFNWSFKNASFQDYSEILCA